MVGSPEGLMAPGATMPLPRFAHLSSPAWSTPSPPTTTGRGATAAEHRAATTLQCWKRRIWLSRWFTQQAEQRQRRLRLCSLCRGTLAYAVSVQGNHRPPPTRPTKPLTQRSPYIPFRIMVCRYHEGGRRDKKIFLVVARVEGIGPVLPILEGGHCVCHFVFGLHRLLWQHWKYVLGPGGQCFHPTSHPTQLPQLFTRVTLLR